MVYQAVVGLEVHAELLTRSKMFCGCPVVDSTQAAPNTAVCPVCAGMPGTLPVVNQQAVEYALRVALALECEINATSLFARKNYFYPDLPKGYQISQFEYPLAERGRLVFTTASGEHTIRIRRVHLEEDTGKLTHVNQDGQSYSLVDLNRAGVPLLEIVSEPDMHSVEEVTAYATRLRAILRAVGVNSGDMEKGVMRFEANVSVRPVGSDVLNTRTEIKNLNSFRSMERAITYEVARQSACMERAEAVQQETVGWNEAEGVTYSQRSKEEAHDYRYFPEPDLPPLVVEPAWVERVRAALPELPQRRAARLVRQYGVMRAEADLLVQEAATADFFEQTTASAPKLPARTVAIWIIGEVFGWLNQNEAVFEHLRVTPAALGELLTMMVNGAINQPTTKAVLVEMLNTGQPAQQIIQAGGLQQISDLGAIAAWVEQVLGEHPQEVAAYINGKETLLNWFFGLVMKLAAGQANPAVVRAELERRLQALKQN